MWSTPLTKMVGTTQSPRPLEQSGAGETWYEWSKTRDARTGRQVWRLTAAPCTNEAPYFESQGFTRDERFLVFASDRCGALELFRVRMEDGAITQLTDGGEFGKYGFNMHPDGQTCLYLTPNAIVLVDVAAGRERRRIDLASRLPGRLMHFQPSVSADGDQLSLTVVDDHDDYHLLVYEFSLDRVTYLLTWPNGFSHPMICPGDRDLMTFVPNGDACWQMELPHHRRTRLWCVDVRDRRPRRFMTPPINRTTTHESWSPDGQRMFFFEKTYPSWTPVAVRSVDRSGGDPRNHFVSGDLLLGHGVASRDGRFFVCDVQKPDDNPLLLIDLETGEADTLCWPDSSIDGGHEAAAHVHPSFSPSGNYVAYTSDVTGHPQVYVAPIDDLVQR